MAVRASFWTRSLVYEPEPNVVNTDITSPIVAMAPAFADLLAVQLPFHAKIVVVYRIVKQVWVWEQDDEPLEERGRFYANSPPWIVHPAAGVEQRLQNMAGEARYLVESLLNSARFWSSEWTVRGIERVELKLAPSGEALRLPAPAVGGRSCLQAQGSKGIWNPKNTSDSRCFEWCVRGYLLGVGEASSDDRKLASRINGSFFFNKDGFLKPVDVSFAGLRTPTTLEDISSFEEQNHGRLAITVWRWTRLEWEGATFFEEVTVRTPTEVARRNAQHEVNLLQLSGGHFCLLHNMNAFRSHKGAHLPPLQHRLQK
ncbi:unnamed protein product [Effrenium voratum]|uniref:Uncharacterized protein n=1 Tax=Effrenium voratum TaxID=2562239 RepID=A0AA36N2N6_9DINO|nr:unnamed protein product [Effrenium voratum]